MDSKESAGTSYPPANAGSRELFRLSASAALPGGGALLKVTLLVVVHHVYLSRAVMPGRLNLLNIAQLVVVGQRAGRRQGAPGHRRTAKRDTLPLRRWRGARAGGAHHQAETDQPML
ncbi:hypothetical protein D9M70_451570 [compost metagenome]